MMMAGRLAIFLHSWCHMQVAVRLCLQVQQLLAGQPLRLSLKGLNYMSDDPSDMHVLYLKVRIVCWAGCWGKGVNGGQADSAGGIVKGRQS